MTTYPLRHISIRVPWHDTGWDGRVCTFPRLNGAPFRHSQLESAAASSSSAVRKTSICLVLGTTT